MRLPLGFLTLTMVVGAALFTGCARSPQAKRDKYLTAGKGFLEKKNYRRAILEFQNAVQAMPTDAESRYELGLALAESGEAQRGYNELRRALDLNPKHQLAQLRIAELMASARDPEVVKQGQDELKKLANSGTPEVLNALAVAQLKLGETGDAVQSLQEALKGSPRELGTSIMLAIAKLLQKDAAGAEEVLKKACESAPNSPDPHIVLGEFYARRRRGPEGEAEFQKALSIDPKKYQALYDLALVQDAAGKKQEAEQDFKRLASSGEKAYKPVHALFLFNNGRQNEAIVEFENLFEQDPSDRAARARLVTAYAALHRNADAEKVLAEALKKDPRDSDALTKRAALYQAAGKYVDAEKDLNEVLHLEPDSAQAHYTLAEIHKAEGQPLSERQDLSEALRLSPNSLTARIELAELLAAGKDKRSALELLDQAPANQKFNLSLVTERNWVLWASGDLAEMRKGIDQALAKVKTPDLLIQDGLWKVQAGRVAAGRESLEEAVKMAPADVRAMEALYNSYVFSKTPREGLEKIKEYASRQPKSAPVQEFLGLCLQQNGDRTKARAAFEAAKAADPHYIKAALSLVQADVLDGKYEDARTRLKTILATNDRNSMAHLWLGIIDQNSGDLASALGEFRKTVEADAENAQALNNLAYLLAEYANKPDEALPYAEKAREIDPGKPDYADTLGWVLYRKGIYPSAVKQMEVAATEKKSDPVIQYHLAMAYAKLGDAEKGRASLRAGLNLNPRLPEARMAEKLLAEADATRAAHRN